mmetsp:Transcript_116373/g.375881  ORF Transcript_116373/g.375881 Transcript_116373/m.375881 type:complete len:491 (+) Transcript_116373:62-1534(+)
MCAISVIVATTPRGGIGYQGKLPWKIPEDMAHFKRVTMATPNDDGRQNAVIMGRKTWESIPEKFRPLAGRVNVVLSRAAAEPDFASPYPEGVLVAPSVASAVERLAGCGDVLEVFVIGGQAAYEEALRMPNCERLFITRIGKDMECDAFFPAFDGTLYKVAHLSRTRSCDGLPYDFLVYERLGGKTTAAPSAALAAVGGAGQFLHEEYQYLSAIREIIEKGVAMEDRTGVGTLSTFGMQMRFNLQHTFPLLTTKRTFWRGVLEELLWFVKGDTNAKHLSEKGVKIWDANGSRDFLDKRGLSHREEGDLGPVYGFQWRHFGAKYVDMHTDYTGQGVDQLAECVRKIKEDPTDRRILLSAWNPADLSQMALPPCHMFCQFYVANGELSCLMYQRSCDMGLGVPFNIASYSLLTLMMAQVCGLKPGEFIHSMGNAHVYKNHVEPLKTQLERTPRPFPVLRLNPDVKDIDGFQASDFELLGYNPHGKIAMEMAV